MVREGRRGQSVNQALRGDVDSITWTELCDVLAQLSSAGAKQELLRVANDTWRDRVLELVKPLVRTHPIRLRSAFDRARGGCGPPPSETVLWQGCLSGTPFTW